MKSKKLPEGIYAITAEKFSRGRDNLEIVKEMISGGASVIQYREKDNKTINEKYLQCKEIRKLTRDAGVMFIVNDAIDIAMLVDADGVHIGQDDLPVSEVRRLIGKDKIIGLSTHTPQQALEAFKSEVDYIGVGPIFKTETKVNVCDPVGLEYLEYVVKNIDLPFVAIGGIKKHNIDQVVKRGAKSICLVTEIVEANDVAAEIRTLEKCLQNR